MKMNTRIITVIALKLIPGFVLFCAGAINLQAATIYVTNLTQKISSTGGCSLPEAIYSSALHTNQAPDPASPGSFITTQAGVGDGDDTIVLPAGAVLIMSDIINDVQNGMGPTATPVINSKITIEANGARIEHAANNKNFRAFAVNPGESLTIRNAYIKGFTVKGGDGAEGGGGGLGAGGAIYVREAILTVDGCTFEGNGAAGGNGSPGDQIKGGGGGGLGGNGGFAGGGSTGGGGGGGGGSRGNGADGEKGTAPNGRGGGGGGTISNGVNFFGGFDCGADGGGAHAENIINGDDGDDADTSCSGGGGGGGQCAGNTSFSFTTGSGGSGSYGGGGGGGGAVADFGGDGGDGGFGGGGGSAETFGSNLDGFGPNGGNGGFGAGGGAGAGGFISGGPGSGGSFAGNATIVDGGGGAGLGGAIFNDGGTIKVYNSTFFNNFVVRGLRGDGGLGASDAGGAIFSRNGSLEVYNSTIASNQSTGADAGIFVYEDGADTVFTLRNTIIANNGNDECHFVGTVTHEGSGNFIVNNLGCPGNVNTNSADPQLGPLQINYPGTTPTMAITTSSPAFDAGDDANCQDFDQRRISRPQFAHCDIGAYELAENLPPVAKCKSVIVSAGPNCTAAASIDDGSFDYDAGDHITLTQNPPAPYPLGLTAVTLTVADNHGGTSTCSSVVTVLDQTPPSITCPASITRGSDPGQCGAIVTFAPPTANDNCGDFHVACSPASGSFFSQGTTPVVCTANDAAGNTNSCAFNVTVSQAAVCGITVSGNSGGGTTVCPGNGVVLTAPNGMKHYFWSGPEQNGSTLQTIVVSTPGTYNCTQEQWYGSTNCCSVTVANYPPPPCNITGNLLITNGLPTTLVGPAGMLSQYWTGPQNNGLFSRSNTVALAGTYVLHLTTSNGCQGACTVTVTNKTPVPCSITASGDAGGLTICSGRKTTLTAANGMTSYLWSGPEQNGATAKFVNVGTQGTYTVRQIDYLGLTNSCSVFLVVNPLRVVNIFGVRTICQGSNTTLYGPDGMKTYLWLGPQHNGLGTQSNTVSFPGTYTLQITDNNGCQNALSVPVTTVPCP
jgi:hypothetical protein